MTLPKVGRELLKRIRAHEAEVAVLGMGYVGLPLAMVAHDAGFRILAYDIDTEKVRKLNQGESYIRHLQPGKIAAMAKSDRFHATSKGGDLKSADILIFCVPTPLTKQREPDMRFIEATAETVAAILRPGQLVVLESTTYPGTTDELLKIRLEKTGLICGKDFFLAFSPEREDPGNKAYGTFNTRKIVGGVDKVSGDLANTFYSAIVKRAVLVSDARTAEAAKLTENVFRAINIALVNELKIMYDKMGIDVWEVLDAASTKPFGFMRFNPGPGWGGHCIPLDPFYLTWKAREFGQASNFIEHAGEINVRMPDYVIEKLMLALNERRKSIKGSKVLMLGVAYKKDIDDPRESPAFEILSKLLQVGAKVDYHDPLIPVLPRMREWPHLPVLRSVPLDDAVLKGRDAVVLVTDHSSLDYARIAKHAKLIIDTRGVYRKQRANVEKA